MSRWMLTQPYRASGTGTHTYILYVSCMYGCTCMCPAWSGCPWGTLGVSNQSIFLIPGFISCIPNIHAQRLAIISPIKLITDEHCYSQIHHWQPIFHSDLWDPLWNCGFLIWMQFVGNPIVLCPKVMSTAFLLMFLSTLCSQTMREKLLPGLFFQDFKG